MFFFVEAPLGMAMSRSGFANKASTWLACWVTGVRARRLRGRLERGSWEVGMDSGIGSDMVKQRDVDEGMMDEWTL